MKSLTLNMFAPQRPLGRRAFWCAVLTLALAGFFLAMYWHTAPHPFATVVYVPPPLIFAAIRVFAGAAALMALFATLVLSARALVIGRQRCWAAAALGVLLLPFVVTALVCVVLVATW